MELQYYGANCIRLVTKNAVVVIDDNIADLGGSSVIKSGDIAIYSGAHGEPAHEVKLVIDQPGEYEVSGISVQGIAARGHMDEEGGQSATIFKLIVDDTKVAIIGHVHPELDDNQLEAIGMVDVLIIPVGGNGYTLDPVGALKLIKKIEPKVVIPTHYNDAKLTYPVPQQELSAALTAMSMEPKETVPKLKVKSSDLGEGTQLIVLERQ